MRQPNSFGTIALIDGKSKRRKPYRVQVHLGFKKDMEKGTVTPIRKTIGYVSTKKEGKQLLAEYHNKPYDLDMANVSFKYLYDKWYKYKEKTVKSMKHYNVYISYYSHLLTKTFNDITREDLQMIVDSNPNLTGEYQRKIVNLYSQLNKYAKLNNINVGADVSQFVITNKRVKSNLHTPFTDDEIKELWNYDNDVIKMILIMIYTGLRPNELLKITEVNEDYFITGSKTEAGKNRVVPLNTKIKTIFHDLYSRGAFNRYKSSDDIYQATKKRFEAIGMDNHTPYDARHTFATLMDKAKANEHCIKLIMGHSIKDLTKRVYTHKEINELIREVNKI